MRIASRMTGVCGNKDRRCGSLTYFEVIWRGRKPSDRVQQEVLTRFYIVCDRLVAILG